MKFNLGYKFRPKHWLAWNSLTPEERQSREDTYDRNTNYIGIRHIKDRIKNNFGEFYTEEDE